MMKLYCSPVSCKKADLIMHRIAVDREKLIYRICSHRLDVITTVVTMCLEK